SIEKNDEAKRKGEQLKKRDILAYYKYILEEAYKTSVSFNTNIKDFVDKVNDNPIEVPPFQFLPLNSLKRAFETGMTDEVLFAFTDKHNNKEGIVDDFSRIYTITETLYTRFSHLIMQIDKAREFDHQRKLEVREGINNSKNLLQKVITSGIVTSTSLLDSLGEMLQKYHQMKNNKIDFHRFPDQFLNPLNNELQLILNNHLVNEELIALENVTAKAIMTYRDISMQNESLAKDIEENDYNSNINDCKLLKEKISKYFQADQGM
ncbi:MAG TPA: hypothetical protein VHA52_13155, partial [Candidatus Babeliaceae bacterium]|nr:hypothetical protein [Candidatus Babeliaceae bacterium]